MSIRATLACAGIVACFAAWVGFAFAGSDSDTSAPPPAVTECPEARAIFEGAGIKVDTFSRCPSSEEAEEVASKYKLQQERVEKMERAVTELEAAGNLPKEDTVPTVGVGKNSRPATPEEIAASLGEEK